MLQKIVKFLGGDPNKREIERYSATVDRINSLEPEFEQLSDDALRAKTDEFRARLKNGETLDDVLPEAFAAVREASKRTLGLRHYDVQMVGGLALHNARIAEMRTGEGKTLVATLPLYLNALLGRGAHLITVNDYLARRDARWMSPIYNALGMTAGVLQMAARTENGRNAFVVDLEKEAVREDQHQLRLVTRGDAYQADITYGTNSEFGFDYLRDNLTMRLEDRVQRGHYFAIVDEVDNILIDEARTPLIISGPAQDDAEWYLRMAQVVRQLQPEDYEINEKDHAISLTEVGEVHVEELVGQPLRDPDRPEDITPEQARLMGYLEQGLRAQHLYRRNKDYLVQGGKVVIIDEFTGRLMPGRRWSDGLHQAVEAKEGVKVEAENVTYATITIQNYFRMYEKLAGMSGTAATESEEFFKIYKLDVLPIPMNLEFQASRSNSAYQMVEAKDAEGYKYTFYARKEDKDRKPIFFRRKDYPDVVYRSEEGKLRAITEEVLRTYVRGRPQLLGTTSVEHSERLSNRLDSEAVRRLAQVLMVRDAYIEKNKIEIIERAIPELAPLNGPIGNINVGTLRQIARDLGLTLNPEDPANLSRLIRVLGLTAEDEPRLVKALQGGIPHQVLNARKHDEESQIIAKAGAFGAVTIATNMAGRGVDIKLGGELDEALLGDVNRVLARLDHDAYNMNHEQRRETLRRTDPAEFGLYEEAVQAFLQYMDEMDRVRELGGLHVIGSERHEARRIDNQLRGRAARQGDPGSSRFYLSLEDDLMRLFGGGQVEGLMNRLNIDENLPIESGLVGRLVEQSQTRVEGSNFDVRKHLLEYDDVLNAQRKRIYDQRDRVFSKEDLGEDILEMLQTDLQTRIPTSLKDEEGPWKLLAFLEEIQPAIEYEDQIYPSFTLRLLISELAEAKGADSTPSHLRENLLTLAGRALQADRDHIIRTFDQFLDRTEENLETQETERIEALETFLEGLEEPEEDAPARKPQESLEELSLLVRAPLRLNNEQLRRMTDDPRSLVQPLTEQVRAYITGVAVNRTLGAFERRLGEPLQMRQPADLSWDEFAAQAMREVESLLDRRYDRLLGNGGQVARDLDPLIDGLTEYVTDEKVLLNLLGVMAQGTRLSFDRKTHRQVYVRMIRVNYFHLASKMLEGRPPAQVLEDVVQHLTGARETLQRVWGRYEWGRLVTAGARLTQLDARLTPRMEEEFGADGWAAVSELPLEEIDPEDRDVICEVLGWRLQNETERQLLLRVISDLWVEYLTRVEALRVSIGLEAYAQRDPLVQYKGKASEMFRELLGEIRMGVLSRMFTYRPRKVSSAMATPAASEAPAEAQGQQPTPPASTQAPVEDASAGGKRRKKRH